MRFIHISLLILSYVGISFCLHKIKLTRQVTSYATVNDHVQSLLKKYFGTVPKSTVNGRGVTLGNYENLEYYGPISMGSGKSAQCFQAQLDTGSSDPWVPGTQCTSDPCKNHKKYNCAKSPTCKRTGQIFELAYGSGDLQAELSYDNFCFGCSNDSPCIENQAFFISNLESTVPFTEAKFDGMVGLAYDSLATNGTVTPFTRLMANSTLCDQQVFSFWLNQNKYAKEGGEMTLCGIDSNHFQGQLTWTPVTEQRYWRFTVDSVAVENDTVQTTFQAIADTGTSLIIGPTDQVLKIYELIGVQYDPFYGAGEVDCREMHKLPAINFTIAGNTFLVHPQHYVLKISGAKECIVGLSGSSLADEFWILGDVFLGPMYTVFDRGNNRLGFAQSYPPFNGAVGIKTGMKTLLCLFALVVAGIMKK